MRTGPPAAVNEVHNLVVSALLNADASTLLLSGGTTGKISYAACGFLLVSDALI